ncbi:MAG: methyl-accepting chemotaxis protein [Aliarcobacter sp.]|nr:methyl-accepting chemotaxis protein [Aliarcobacter sp.]
MISNLNVLKKMLIIGILSLLSFVVISTIFLIDEKHILISEKKSKLVNIVELPYSLVESEYKAFLDGKIDEKTAKENALNAIKKLRYDGKNYIWINDDTLPHPKMIMHPIATSLDGKVLNAEKFNCATELEYSNNEVVKTDGKKNLFQSFVEVVNKGNTGFVGYLWPKPKVDGTNTEELYEKLSYVKKFEKWGWVIGSGIYIDDIEKQFNSSLINIVFVVLVILFVLGITSYFIVKDIVTKVNLLDNGLVDFFKFLNKENNNVKFISIDSNDEIGKMAKVINENIEKTQKLIIQDHELIEDVKRVVNEVKHGKLDQRIIKHTQNQSLEELKNTFNEMIENTSSNVAQDINKLIRVLDNFAKFDFRDRVDNDSGLVSKGLNNLAQIINEMLVENKSNGLTLDESSNILLANVNRLNLSSNEAAASLEETAAALEQITSNIRNNTQNIAKMASFSNNVTKSANDGEKLANQTTVAMDEINVQVNSINEAITVIDQIAFQTNILSLNAAVEAATAGEAGKGFAVVAAEVRNLASRSAEAAKEIKTIVENATSKANQGKQIANNMIEGYKGLNQNISQTINLISEIESASREQLLGIEQINSAVNQLDQQTQLNASIATQTQDVARVTDEIAKLVIKSVDNKEFDEKNSVKARNMNISSVSHNSINVVPNKKMVSTIEKKVEKTVVAKADDGDDWESF